MYVMDMQPRFYCHEIGHGLIAYLYHEKYYKFDGITFDSKRIIELNLNPHDKAYTISFPVDNLESLIQENPQHAAAIDGLLLLGGIAGATYFPPAGTNQVKQFDHSNFMSVLDSRGSEGDFEIINRARRPYGRFLYSDDAITDEVRNDAHSKTLKVLEVFFLLPEIQHVSARLYERLTATGNLYLKDFNEVIGDELKKQLKAFIENELIAKTDNEEEEAEEEKEGKEQIKSIKGNLFFLTFLVITILSIVLWSLLK